MTATPQDHKAKAPTKADEKRQREMVAEFMTTEIDLSPNTVALSDGLVWEFTPDPMPSDTARMQDAMGKVSAAANATGMGKMAEDFQDLITAIADMLWDEDQRALFLSKFRAPDEKATKAKPYGTNVALQIGLRVVSGRSGFPTSED